MNKIHFSAIFFLILVFSINQSYAQENQTEIKISELITIKESSESEKPVQQTELSEIKEMMGEIRNELIIHDQESLIQSIGNNLVGIIGGIVGILGLGLTIRQAKIDSERRKEEAETKEKERKKIENTENKIKWTLGDVLEHLKMLNENPPEQDKLHSVNGWKRTKEFVRVLRLSAIPIAKDLKGDLGDLLLGYTVFMERQFERAEKKEKVSLSALIRSTERILNKHFSDFQKEREDIRAEELKHFEEEMQKIQDEEAEAYEKYMEEQGIADQLMDEYYQHEAEKQQLEDEQQDAERAIGEEEFEIDMYDDEENQK